MEIDVTLYFAKTTKGTAVYREDEDTPQDEKIIPSLYIRKTAMVDYFGTNQKGWPRSISVIVDAVD